MTNKTIEAKVAEFDEKFGNYDLNTSAMYRGKEWKARDIVKDWLTQALTEVAEEAKREETKKTENATERVRREALSILKKMLSNEASSSEMYQEFKSKIFTQEMKNKMDKLCRECAHDICSACNISCHNPDCALSVKPQLRCYDNILGKPSNHTQ